jgi:serine phosphatase RsbU (regulator of sigma subunit)/CHASE3 domain sensor protein
MKLSLRWKIVGGFGLLLMLIALSGWVTLSLFGSLRSVQRRVFDEAVPALAAVDEIIRSYTAQSAAVRGSLIGSQEQLLEQYRMEVSTARLWEQRARRLFEDSEERRLLDHLSAAGDSFHRLVDDRVIPLARSGDRSKAFLILDDEGSPLIAEIEIEGELLRAEVEERFVQTEAEVSSTTRNALVILAIVVAGALGAGTLLAIVLPDRLSRNLARLVEATRAIGRGDLDQRVEIRSGDEFEELSRRFGEMQAGLKRLQQLALHDRELEIAATIQRNLLQRTMPEHPAVRVVPLQRQANLVGGDWYDVELSGRGLSLVVGDASGKGIAAALMAAVALSFLRAERGLGSTIKRIVRRTNDALLDATDPDSFTTLIYATVDPHTGEARWLNMGHPAPFLLRPSGADRRGPEGNYVEGPRNRALGWFEEPGLEEGSVGLLPGDCLVMFTDGWLEAKSPAGEVFGENRFAEAIVRLAPLGPAELGARLVEEVERFAAGKLDDDLTMLVVEYTGVAEQAPTPAESRLGDEQWHSRR